MSVRTPRPAALSLVAIVVILISALAIGVSGAAFNDTTENNGNSITAATTFADTFRVTTYEVRTGTFTGTNYTLTLDQALASDYFVVLRGAAGNGSSNRNPNQNYARVTGDPHSNFATVTGAAQLRLSRSAAGSSWQGQVTVIESLGDSATSGFQLLDVVEISLASGVTAGSGTSTPGWADIGQVGVYGGIRGGG